MVVARGAVQKDIVLPPGLFVDWHDGTLLDGGAGGVTVTVPAALDKLPLLLVDGTLLPLLDPTIDTLADETNPDVVGPGDVADVYDVVGMISKSTGAAQFTLADGGTAMDPEVIARLLAHSTAAEGPLGRLSPREREVLSLMAEGRSNAAIAARLVVTERAVAKHTAAIFTKLDLQPSDDDNRRVLAVLAHLGP